MSILEKLRLHQTTTAGESAGRDKESLTEYRAMLCKPDHTREDIATLADLVGKLRLDPGDVESDQTALASAAGLHARVAAAVKRWPEIEQELGRVLFDQLRLRDHQERAIATRRQMSLENEQAGLATSTIEATAEIGRLRQNHPRVSASIEPIAPDVIPQNVLKANPLLCALLAAAVWVWGTTKQHAQFLRFRNVRMSSSGGWMDPVDGIAPMHIALKKQVERDLSPAKDLLSLLSNESGFH